MPVVLIFLFSFALGASLAMATFALGGLAATFTGLGIAGLIFLSILVLTFRTNDDGLKVEV